MKGRLTGFLLAAAVVVIALGAPAGAQQYPPSGPDVVVDSSEEGIRKPDPRIFTLTLERLGVVDATRAVFLDDFDGNVAAAAALGMHTILVGPDPHPAMTELLALLDA